jgi:ribosomal protein S18 acetylase RimI-like enzyme
MGWEELQSKEVFVAPGVAESRRFGLQVLNVQCGLFSEDKRDGLANALTVNPFDLAVVRYPSSLEEFGLSLADLDHHVIYADPTVYWGIPVRKKFLNEIPGDLRIQRVNAEYLDQMESVIRSSFSGYRSHWHYNPQTKNIRMEDAYFEWVSHKINQPGSTCYLMFHHDEPAGFALTEVKGDFGDVLLAGIARDFQAMGLYKYLLTQIEYDMSMGEIQEMVISTQSRNTAVQKAWTRYGLIPLMTVQTVHFEKRKK